MLEQVVAGRRRGLQEIAGAHELGRGPVADLHLHGDDAVQQQQPQAAHPGSSHSDGVCSPIGISKTTTVATWRATTRMRRSNSWARSASASSR